MTVRIPLTLVLIVVIGGVAMLALVYGGSSTSKTVHGSGVLATQTRTVSGFTSLDLAGSNIVIVRVGGRQSIVVRGDDNLLDRITTKAVDGRLVIGTRGSFTTKAPMRVDLTVPSLKSLTLSGSGIIDARGLDAPSLVATLAGSGVLRVSGAVTRLSVALAGSGDVQLAQLVAHDVHAVVAGSGRVLVTATDSLDAAVRGVGAIVYGGNPAHVTTSVSGTGCSGSSALNALGSSGMLISTSDSRSVRSADARPWVSARRRIVAGRPDA